MIINISTPHTKLAIVREGLYRLNVVPGDATELIVRKGRVILNDTHTKVKGGNKVVFSATSTAVAKLTSEEKKKSLEDIEVWSKDRSKMLAKVNSRITNRMLTTAFNEPRDWGSLYYGSRNGFWFFSRLFGCYTFLPLFYARGTPYGSTYQTTMYIGGYPGGYSSPSYTRPVVGNGSPSSSAGPGTVIPGASSSPQSRPGPVSAPMSSPELGNRAIRKLETMTDPGRPNP